MTIAEGKLVFISYARRDGAGLAMRLQKDLNREGFEVWLDIDRIEAGASWTPAIENAIDRAQFVVAILTPGSFASSICRAEQLRSLRKGKKVIPVLGQPDADVPLHLEVANYRDFTVAENYQKQLRLLLLDLTAGENAVELRPQFRSTLVTAPPLPRNYLPRPEAIASLRNAVITEQPGNGIALTAFKGMGGIGKTVLAQALCHDEVVQQAFPDGIVWTTVGKEPAYSLTVRIREVCRALGFEVGTSESELYSIDRYRTILQDKAALIVVDDVWHSQDIAPFLAESPRSKLLFTTRDELIASVTGARVHTADLLTLEESRDLLANWAEQTLDSLPPEADRLVTECGRLPLAVSMVGAMLRGKPLQYWGRVLAMLQQADLGKIRAQFPFYPHPDLLRAIQVSVDALREEDAVSAQRYLTLAVTLEDMTVAPAIQRTLWNTEEDEASEAAERFIGLSLAQRDGDGSSFRLHDLQLDYIRAQYGHPEALALIHGAARLAAHLIAKEPQQFASQLIGRLLPDRDVPAIQQFVNEIAASAPAPWLRPLKPALIPPGTSLLRTLEGHTSSVLDVALTPDGKLIVSASADHTLNVWDMETGRVLHTLEGHSAAVNGVMVTPDSKRAVSASQDHTLKVWDLRTGRTIRELKGHAAAANSVAVTPDGKWAISASADHTLRAWDLDTGRVVRKFRKHYKDVSDVKVTPDGTRLISTSRDGTLKLWDLNTGRALREFKGHTASLHGATITPDGKRVISASSDRTLKLWELDTGRTIRTLKGHRGDVAGVAVTPDGRWVVSAAADHAVKVWDLDTGRVLRTFRGHSASVHAVAIAPDGERVVSASEDLTLKVWDLERLSARRAPTDHYADVRGVAVAPDGIRGVSASADRTLKVWDLESGLALHTLVGHSFVVSAVAVTPDGKRAVSASLDHTLKVWDLDTGRILSTLEGHGYSVYGVAVTQDGKRAVSASGDHTLKVWNLETGQVLRTLEGHRASLTAVAITPDGKRAISASRDRTLKVWDLGTGIELHTLRGHSGDVCDVAVVPGGRRAVSASEDHTMKVWDLDAGVALQSLNGHSGSVNCVAVRPDGNRAVSASADNSLGVWDLISGLRITTFYCDAPASCCAFAGLQRIFAGDASGRVHILSLEEPGARTTTKTGIPA